MLLEGRVAFLTGAGSGIGRAGALALAREGAVVTVTDLDGARAQMVAQEILAAGGRAEAMELDAADDIAVLAAVDSVAVRGRLDILHSHAGIQVPGRLTEIDPEGMDAIGCPEGVVEGAACGDLVTNIGCCAAGGDNFYCDADIIVKEACGS